MLTRNRGKSKSVVETLGLVKKNKKRVSKGNDLMSTRPALLTRTKERDKAGLEMTVNEECVESGRLSIAADGESTLEVEHLDSAETTPAKWSVSSDKLDMFALDQPSSRRNENDLEEPEKQQECDWLPPKGDRSFLLFDEVLQEILEEISIGGRLFPSRRQFLLSKLGKRELEEREMINVTYVFKEKRLQNLFGKMSADLGRINEEIDRKEALLAPCGLVRPGVARALRKRRHERGEKVKRGAIGRLRPNPRPRRFSDMVNSNMEVSGRLTRLSRSGKRVRDRNVRVAAKKLAQAKSQASHILQSKRGANEAKRGRPRKSSRAALLESSTKWGVSRGTAIQTRPRRSVNIRHHIEWKFCYGGTNEKTSSEVLGNRNGGKRRAPASDHTSLDEAEGEDTRVASAKEINQMGDGEEDKERVGLTHRRGEMGAKATTSFVSSGVERTASRCGGPVRRARSILFERKRRRKLQSESRSRSSSESSSAVFDGAALHYRRGDGVGNQSRNAPFLGDKRKKGGSSFYGRPSVRSFEGARNAVDLGSGASNTIGERVEKVRASHHRRDSHRRLTLLDRVVLGLTCSVVQDGDEIHIKQLHSGDLSILLQRLTDTDFSINGLSTKTNTNNEQEFNITLIYRTKAEASIRQTRRHNIVGTSPLSALRGAQLSTTPPSQPPQIGGVGVSVGSGAEAMLGGTHSEGEEEEMEEGGEGDENGLRRRRGIMPGESPRPSSAMGFFSRSHQHHRASHLLGVARRVGSGSGRSSMLQHHHAVLQRMGMRHLSAAAAAVAAAAVSRSSSSGGGVSARRPCSREGNAVGGEGVGDAGEVPPAYTNVHQHTASPPFVMPLGGGPGFRRHSPRKIIRKVYTGTSTVPKILNRRRLLIAGGSHSLPTNPQQVSAPPFGTMSQLMKPSTGMTVATSTPGIGIDEVGAEKKSLQVFAKTAIAGAPEMNQQEGQAVIEGAEEKSKGVSVAEVSGVGVSRLPGSSISEVVVSATTATPTTAVAVAVGVSAVSGSSEEDRLNNANNPANSMCASQLLRMKRHHDEQPQFTTGLAASSSVEAPSPSSSPALSQSSQQKGQRKLNVAQQRRTATEEGEEVVVGLAGGVVVGDVDDGTDFELNNALIHLPRGSQALTSLPSHQTVPLAAVTAGTAVAAPLSLHTQSSLSAAAAPARLHHQHHHQQQQQQQQQQSAAAAAVLQCIAPAVVPPQSQVVAKPVLTVGKRALIPSMNATSSAVLPGVTASLLTGRPAIASSRNVMPSVATSADTAGGTASATATATAVAAAAMMKKRPVVHKYHTFRKISPKNQTTTSVVGATVATKTHSATSQVLKSLLESPGSSVSGGTLAKPQCSTNPRGLSGLPAQQAAVAAAPALRASRNSGMLPSSSPSTSSMTPAVGVAGSMTRFSQAPAHQSRGTWQLGGRAIVIGASITTPASASSTQRFPPPPTSSPDGSSGSGVTTVKTVEPEADVVPQPVLHETVGS